MGKTLWFGGLLFTCTAALAPPAGAQTPDQPQAAAQGHHETPQDAPGAAARPLPGAAHRLVVSFGLLPSYQVNVDANGANIPGDAANEPSLAVDPTNPNNIVIGWRQFDTISSNFREAGVAYSRDAGRTWTFPGALDDGNFRSDPVLNTAADGTFYYYSLRGNFLCDVFISRDAGETWEPPIFAFGGDKAWFTVDNTASPGAGNLYVAWSTAGNPTPPNQFTRSTNGGQTWMQPTELPDPKPRWGTLAVNRDGDLYLSGTSGGGIRVLKSTNAKFAGQTPTFTSTGVNLGGNVVLQALPNPGGLLGQVWIGVDTSGGPMDGNVYMLASVDPAGADPMDVMFARSEDGGQTWSAPVRVNDDAPGTNAWQWFGTMSVAPNGRIDAIWNDTRNTGVARESQLFYAASFDGGVTWSMNEQISPTFDSYLGWPNQNKLGDYYDMKSDNVGANVAYAATFNGEQDVYFLRIGDFDCNGNGVGDAIDIAGGVSSDMNGNGIPDECEGLGDLNCDGALDAFDIEAFITALLDPGGYANQYPGCDINRADIDGSGAIDAFDIEPFVTLLLG